MLTFGQDICTPRYFASVAILIYDFPIQMGLSLKQVDVSSVCLHVLNFTLLEDVQLLLEKYAQSSVLQRQDLVLLNLNHM